MSTVVTCVYQFNSQEEADRFQGFIAAAMRNEQAKNGNTIIACAQYDVMQLLEKYKAYVSCFLNIEQKRVEDWYEENASKTENQPAEQHQGEVMNNETESVSTSPVVKVIDSLGTIQWLTSLRPVAGTKLYDQRAVDQLRAQLAEREALLRKVRETLDLRAEFDPTYPENTVPRNDCAEAVMVIDSALSTIKKGP